MRSFPMSLDPSATIVTGENGSGKSTVLRAIHLISNAQWTLFHELPLAGIELVFPDDSRLSVTNNETGVVVAGRGEPWAVDLQAIELADPRRRHEMTMLRRELESRVRAGAAT